METLAYALFIAYRDGQDTENDNDGWAPDEQKAAFYLANILTTASPKNIVDNTLFWFGWLTTVRLAFMRVFDREYTSSLPFLPQVFSTNFSSLVASNFKLFQFSYAPELLFCFIKLISESFRPKTEEDKDKWFYERFERKRFLRVFLSRKFWGTFSNALVWLAVNIVFFGISTPVACAFNLAAFMFDIVHDWYLAHREKKEYQKLQETPMCEEYGLQNQLTNKIKELTFKRKYATIVAIGIFFGMLIFYAPILIPGLSIWLGTSTAWYGAGIAMALRHLDFLKWLGASLVMFSAVGVNFIWGRLNTFFTKNFYKNLYDFLKNNRIESIITGGLVAGAFILKIFFPATIFATIFTFGIPTIIPLTFLAVKAVSYLWQQGQGKQSNSALQLVEEKEKLTLREAIQEPKMLFKHELQEASKENSVENKKNTITNTCNMIRTFQTLLLADEKDEEKKSERRDLILRASNLSTAQLDMHLRNWGKPNNEREILDYATPEAFFKKLVKSSEIAIAAPTLAARSQQPMIASTPVPQVHPVAKVEAEGQRPTKKRRDTLSLSPTNLSKLAQRRFSWA
jgi:hypothetical protein